jgi:hypothetical protein
MHLESNCNQRKIRWQRSENKEAGGKDQPEGAFGGVAFANRTAHATDKSSRPAVPCGGPRMNPSLDDGNPPRPFRHLRMAEHRSPDLSSSRAPVHSVLVQKSVTTITNPAGRLSTWMLGKSRSLGKWKTAKSWQAACNQSNETVLRGTCAAATAMKSFRRGKSSLLVRMAVRSAKSEADNLSFTRSLDPLKFLPATE